ncbi:hypothetical protein B0H67DRAFT_648751 [Lasiosphaeris hirsuta]|uniref:Uncharacterized protein n=1 Tax=Lasiosphaeris hirsuta TaxID=260670 RepID=A0AA39ZVG8_9PEZI|nr:hypothetical protein B0H67DRAFT_648751 [Lasiosphaeris hirsuta]
MIGKRHRIFVHKYIICTNAVLTPGILSNSGFHEAKLPALGGILFKRDLVKLVGENPYGSEWWRDEVAEHQRK